MRNKTNVKYVNIEYVENDKKTTCNLMYEIEIDRWPIMGFQIDSKILVNVASKLGMTGLFVDKDTFYPAAFRFTVTAQAACDDKDEYNPETGRRIALTRAQGKAFEKTCKFYDLLQIELDKSFNEITRVIDNNWHAANKCWDHAKELGGY